MVVFLAGELTMVNCVLALTAVMLLSSFTEKQGKYYD